MPKFVTFDDGYGRFNWRAIFPSTATKKEIHKAAENKVRRELSKRGLDSTDFDFDNIKEFTTIVGYKEGKFYEPELGGQWYD